MAVLGYVQVEIKMRFTFRRGNINRTFRYYRICVIG
jgi:hypothetical protein